MAKKYDDFDEEGGDGFFDQVLTIVSHKKREFAIVSVVAAVVLLGLVVWGSYPDGEEVAAGESVPIVRASAGDYKTTPDNPGGMEIPYRDSTVFSAADTNTGPENILADETSEQPMPRSELFAGLNTTEDAAAPAAVDEIAAAQEFAKVEAVEPPSNDTLVAEAIGVPPMPKAAIVEEKVAIVQPAPEPAKPAPVKEDVPEAKIESAAGTVAAKAVSGGNSYIQLASVKDTSRAAAEYKKIQGKYTGLAGIDYRTQAANLGAKGTFHRIQAGPMSKDDATRICNQIKQVDKNGCLVVAK